MNIKETEQKLTDLAVKSWERLRSSDELQTFIGRRELALQMVPVESFDDLV